MATNRGLVFANGEIYHIFNRGIERRKIFGDKREYQRMIDLVNFYRFANLPVRYSRYHELKAFDSTLIWEKLQKLNNLEVSIICYSLMPNHFHFVLKQQKEHGISRFMANISNGYTKYYNIRHLREGPLFQGVFKGVCIETDEQLIHVTRYVHLNPVTSFLIKSANLENYTWSSFPEYLGINQNSMCEKFDVLSNFSSKEEYKRFVFDQIHYAQELHKIKHLCFDHYGKR